MSRLAAPLDAEFDRVVGAWRQITEPFRASVAGRALIARIDARVRAGATIYPPQPLRALELTPFEAVRVVILGQDPYHGPGQAEGLAFSVAPGCRPPPSLRNIHKELQRDLGQAPPASGSLVRWAEQGVLLINSTLTVEQAQPTSHAGWGWEALTDALVAAVARRPGRVFMLWGAHAQAKAPLLAGGSHLVLRANHPSPLSALRPPLPFIGCGHFSAAARQVAGAGGRLDWSLA
jgi:uracil-DNA glycosylase